MNERAMRLANVAAAAVAIGGVLVVAFPTYGASILQLVIATIAGAAGVSALAANVPIGGWLFPFKWMSPFNPQPNRVKRSGSDETASIRSKLGGWRRPFAGGPPMPPEVLRLLRPLVAASMDVDVEDEVQLARARDRLSPLAWAVLTSDPRQPVWSGVLPPRPSEVASVVMQLLDDIDLLTLGAGDPRRPGATHQRDP